MKNKRKIISCEKKIKLSEVVNEKGELINHTFEFITGLDPNTRIEGQDKTLMSRIFESLLGEKPACEATLNTLIMFGGNPTQGVPSAIQSLEIFAKRNKDLAKRIKNGLPGYGPDQYAHLAQMMLNVERGTCTRILRPVFPILDGVFYRKLAEEILLETVDRVIASNLKKSRYAMGLLQKSREYPKKTTAALKQLIMDLTPKECLELSELGSETHAVNVVIAKGEARGGELTVCNRGSGIETYGYYRTYRFNTIDPMVEILISNTKKSAKNIADFYLLLERKAEENKIPRLSFKPRPQKGGNCTWASLMAGLRFMFDRHDRLFGTHTMQQEFKPLKLKIIAATKGKMPHVYQTQLEAYATEKKRKREAKRLAP